MGVRDFFGSSFTLDFDLFPLTFCTAGEFDTADVLKGLRGGGEEKGRKRGRGDTISLSLHYRRFYLNIRTMLEPLSYAS